MTSPREQQVVEAAADYRRFTIDVIAEDTGLAMAYIRHVVERLAERRVLRREGRMERPGARPAVVYEWSEHARQEA